MKTTIVVLTLSTLLGLSLTAQPALADCPLAHTHIGINPTWRPDWNDPGNPAGATDPVSSDDNQLWMFSIPPVHAIAPTPGWPEWGDPTETPFLKLVQELDAGGNPITKAGEPDKTLYTCRFMYGPDGYGDPDGMQHLDGWHSAEGPQGVWDLAIGDELNEPEWDIGIRRQGTSMSDPTDFFMLRPDDSIVLDADSDTYKFSDYGEKIWEGDEGRWGIHSHMTFHFWLASPQPADVFSATFTAFDDGGMYTPSDPFTFRFAVPEPGTLSLVLVAGLLVGVRRH